MVDEEKSIQFLSDYTKVPRCTNTESTGKYVLFNLLFAWQGIRKNMLYWCNNVFAVLATSV